jgi:ribonuclease P protein component
MRRHRMRSADFARVYSQGSRARGSLLTVAVCPNGLDRTRLGLSIGKRVWKRAVRRNRVRRVFREAFRLSLAELPEGVDVVLIGAPGVMPELEATRRELVTMCRKALRRYRDKQGDKQGDEQRDGKRDERGDEPARTTGGAS